MNIGDLEIMVPKLLLLNDGLLALATVPDNLFAELIKIPAGNVPITLEPLSNGVFLKIHVLFVDLSDDMVFDHLQRTGKVWVYLSDYNQYVMTPWLEADIIVSELWAAKGIADYLKQKEVA